MNKISQWFTDTFGDAGKWILLGIMGVGLVIVVVTFFLVVKYIKYVIIGLVAIFILAIVGLILYKRFKK